MGEMKSQVPYSNPLANDALHTAASVADHTKEALNQQLVSQAQRSAGQLGEVATALRKTSHDLDQNAVAPYIEKAADRIDRVSDLVRSADVQAIRRTVEDFARREPLVFLGGAFALGMLGARFLKSSASRGDGR